MDFLLRFFGLCQLRVMFAELGKGIWNQGRLSGILEKCYSLPTASISCFSAWDIVRISDNSRDALDTTMLPC